MKAKELSTLSETELTQKEKALKSELAKLKQQRYLGRIDKPHMVSLLKRDIARIKTALNKINRENPENRNIKSKD